MSIEEKIEGLTAAITQLNVHISALVNNANFGNLSAATSVAAVTPKEEVAGESSPKKTRKPKEKAPDPIEEELTDTAASSTESDDLDLGIDDKPAPEITHEQLKAIVSELSKKKGRETVLKLFKKFSLTTFNDVKPEQYAAMHADATELLGG